jgi:hypothetical protein
MKGILEKGIVDGSSEDLFCYDRFRSRCTYEGLDVLWRR